ncbi:hypothetical protein J6590_032142 [Homalodisca vitripennis]|nr:hypothetical protein J6590_032142 [Homalodisca vitripennis]
MTVDECKFIVSTNSNWKCDTCSKKKYTRGDNTPIKPSIDKIRSKNNDSDSDTNRSNNSKIVCFKCTKGFSYNSYRAICCKCEGNYHFKCANITKDDYLKQQTQWVCFSCINRNVCDSPNQSNELSPLGLSDNVDKIMTGAESHATMKQSRTVDKIVEFQATMKHSGTADKISAVPPPALGLGLGDVTMQQLFIEIYNLRSDIKQSNAEIITSMNKYGEWIVENGKRMEELSNVLIKTAADIEHLKQENNN